MRSVPTLPVADHPQRFRRALVIPADSAVRVAFRADRGVRVAPGVSLP
ncbi:hypothetical protein [Streptomyces sp. NPDC058955]